MKNKLMILVGLPGSGKTSYSKKYLMNSNTEYLSSDDLRVELFGFESQEDNNKVFEEMRKRTKQHLKNGKNVIYDATNLTRKFRKVLINEMKKHCGSIECYVFTCTIPELLERNIIRQERHLPQEKLLQMIKSFEMPFKYENIDNIYIIRTSFKNEAVFNYNQMAKTFEQDNPYHEENLGQHINWCKKYIENNYILEFDKSNIFTNVCNNHDLGKLFTKEYNETKGHCTFYQHENVSTYIHLLSICSDMFISEFTLSKSSETELLLIQHHMDFYKANLEKTKELLGEENFKLLEMFNQADKYRE